MSILARSARTGMVIVLVALLAGCNGDGGGGPTAVDPNAPAISDLVTSILGACTISGGPGGTIQFTMSFTDPDGNVSGGKATVTGAFDRSASFVFDLSIPSDAASISGTTSGTITLGTCARYDTSTTLIVSIHVTDASGKVSNELSTTIVRPAGFPQLSTPALTPR